MLNTKANTSDVKPVKQVRSSATHVVIWSVDISEITSWFKNYKSTSIVKLLDQKNYNTHVDIWSVDISGITSWLKNYRSTSIVKLLDQRKYGTHVDIWSVDISGITSWFKNYRSTSKLALQTVKTLSRKVIRFIYKIIYNELNALMT